MSLHVSIRRLAYKIEGFQRVLVLIFIYNPEDDIHVVFWIVFPLAFSILGVLVGHLERT